LAGLGAAVRYRLASGAATDLAPSLHWTVPQLVLEPGPDQGPVLVMVEYRVEPSRSSEFSEAMRAFEPTRRKDGARQWGLFRDAAEHGRFVETFVVESGVEHLRQHERVTMVDRELQMQFQAFHIRDTPPSRLAFHRCVVSDARIRAFHAGVSAQRARPRGGSGPPARS
jgi:quinol monooxygenase YgiN